MDKFIDVIVDGILSNFDFGFMFIVNVLTYIIIKTIDYFNGDNKVPTWQKRCVLVISIAAMIGIYTTVGAFGLGGKALLYQRIAGYPYNLLVL